MNTRLELKILGSNSFLTLSVHFLWVTLAVLTQLVAVVTDQGFSVLLLPLLINIKLLFLIAFCYILK